MGHYYAKFSILGGGSGEKNFRSSTPARKERIEGGKRNQSKCACIKRAINAFFPGRRAPKKKKRKGFPKNEKMERGMLEKIGTGG